MDPGVRRGDEMWPTRVAAQQPSRVAEFLPRVSAGCRHAANRRKFRINKVNLATKVPCLPVSLSPLRESKRGSAAPGGGRPVGMSGVRSVLCLAPLWRRTQSARGSSVQLTSSSPTFGGSKHSGLRPLPKFPLLSLTPSPGWGRAHSRLIETRLRELPHPNLPARSEWVPCRIAFAPPAEGRKRGVRGKRASAPLLEHRALQSLPPPGKPMLPGGQNAGTVKPSLTLFWLILARHQQAP